MAASFRRDNLDSPVPEKIQALVAPHVESFNYFINHGLEESINLVDPVEVFDPATKRSIRIWVDRPTVGKPIVDDGSRKKLLPRECREGGLGYTADFRADLNVETSSGVTHRLPLSFGKMPIMVKSKLCHLDNLTQRDLVERGEEALEMGGYFICNGIERIFRLLILPKANYPMGLHRKSFVRKGARFADKGCVIRCTRKDQTSVTNRLLYNLDGTAVLGFSLRKSEFFMPIGIILKGLVESSDHEIFLRLVSAMGTEADASLATPFVAERALLLLSQPRKKDLFNRRQCLEYLGKNFRSMIRVSEKRSDAFVGDKILRDHVLIHLQNPRDKFNLLLFMLQKLYAIVDGTAQPDNADTLQHHDVLLPGQLLTMVVKEKVQNWLEKVAEACEKDLNASPGSLNIEDPAAIKKIVEKMYSNIGQQVEYLLNTGNLVSQSGLDLQQASGFTVVAEKLNFLRYISHFRSVHRGAHFAELRTTTVRKLLPESWGFMCPVHTPDGAPCGLLNHLTMSCLVTEEKTQAGFTEGLIKLLGYILSPYGYIPMSSNVPPPGAPGHLAILLDGCLIGFLSAEAVPKAVADLRKQKVDPLSRIPADLEVGYVPYTPLGTFPGVYLFSKCGRLVRPVRQLRNDPSQASGDHIELIGPFEQGYMEIRCLDGLNGGRDMEGTPGSVSATHEEIHPTDMLSVVANLTPWSDYNQSPRNMYQCQMGKQTMGFPVQSMQHRSDGKLYKLQSPQTPIARTATYRDYCMDDYPTGTNAVVAVLSYTGYDMEDAMIINKSSMERGFCHGQIYKTETVNLAKSLTKSSKPTSVFAQSRGKQDPDSKIGSDGLPEVGQRLFEGQVYCNVLDVSSGVMKGMKLKGTEAAVIDQVAIIGSGSKAPQIQKANIKMRFGRNPIIGDKFSSRHGQKGVLSQLWPDIDMPFSHSSGMRPDIIINPHAFPSRMTIGMLVESMAAKSGALHGHFVNATPFRSSSENPPPYIWPSDSGPSGDGQQAEQSMEASAGSHAASESSVVDEFGQQLAAKGYSYYGTEVMYSGVLGIEMTCEIYMGVVYYQRLRHMVSDKFQVRSTGPVNPLTMQPVKGRKFGGGIRFGEMERDALLSHGAAFLLHDRLHRCSDYHTASVCSICGSLLSPWMEPPAPDPMSTMKLEGSTDSLTRRRVVCQVCKTSKGMEKIAMPYVFKYLATELAAMNIKLTLDLIDS